MPENRKKLSLDVMTTFLKNISAKCTNFEVSKFQPGLGLDYIAGRGAEIENFSKKGCFFSFEW